MTNRQENKVIKGIILSLLLVSGVVNAAAVSGSISVSLVILPSEGCNNKMCSINSEKILNKNNNQDYQVSKDSNLITVSF